MNSSQNPSWDEKLVDLEKYPLEEFLEEDFIQEVLINKHGKVNTYLDAVKMKKLVDYIIKEPVVNSPKRGYKYPFIASEILSVEINYISDKFFQDPLEDKLERNYSIFNLSDSFIIQTDTDEPETYEKKDSVISATPEIFNPPAIEFGNLETQISKEIRERESKDISLNTSLDKRYIQEKSENHELLDYLFSFLNNSNTDLNLVLSGYFSKVLLTLFKTKGSQILRYICVRKPEYLLSILNQIRSKSISEIVSKILQMDFTGNLEESVNFDIVKINILSKLLTSTNKEELSNISDLCLEYFENPKNLESVLSEFFLNCLSNQIKSMSACKEYLFIATQLMTHFKTEYEKAQKFMTSMSMKTKLDKTSYFLNLDMDILLVNKFTNAIDNILELFSAYKRVDSLEIENEKVNACGTFKIAILEFINGLLILSRNTSMLEKFCKYRFFESISIYFFAFTFNDIFQSLVEAMLILLIDDGNESYLDYIFRKCNFLSLLMRNCTSTVFDNLTKTQDDVYLSFGPNKDRRCIKGFFIHCIKISTSIQGSIEKTSMKKVLSTTKNVFTGNNLLDDFGVFYESIVKPYTEKMNYTLGGVKINQMSILALIENNEEFFTKRFDCDINNKKIEDFQSSDFKGKNMDGYDKDDPQGKESEAVHFQKQGITQQLKNIENKTSLNDFFNNNFWEKAKEGETNEEEEEEIFDDLVIVESEPKELEKKRK